MTDIPQDPEGFESSYGRFDTLTGLYENYLNSPQEEVSGELLTSFLASHENAPNCPCVHQNGAGSTLAHSVFDLENRNWKLYFSNPCYNNSKNFKL